VGGVVRAAGVEPRDRAEGHRADEGGGLLRANATVSPARCCPH
jgi:hypothetical protein